MSLRVSWFSLALVFHQIIKSNVNSLDLYVIKSLVAHTVKSVPAAWETQVLSLGQEDPWRREWLPTPVFLPRKYHGQRSLLGYSLWGLTELDTNEQLTLYAVIIWTKREHLWLINDLILGNNIEKWKLDENFHCISCNTHISLIHTQFNSILVPLLCNLLVSEISVPK